MQIKIVAIAQHLTHALKGMDRSIVINDTITYYCSIVEYPHNVT